MKRANYPIMFQRDASPSRRRSIRLGEPKIVFWPLFAPPKLICLLGILCSCLFSACFAFYFYKS